MDLYMPERIKADASDSRRRIVTEEPGDISISS